MELDFSQVEEVAAWLCNKSGGDWQRKKTHRNLWRRRAAALMELAKGNKPEAEKIMRGGK